MRERAREGERDTLGVVGASGVDLGINLRSKASNVLLWLEEDDVDLGGKEASQHHRTAQTHRDAHGGSLHLKNKMNTQTFHTLKQS